MLLLRATECNGFEFHNDNRLTRTADSSSEVICLLLIQVAQFHYLLYDGAAMKNIRNITRFTYEFTSFQGWRVTLCRNQMHFTRYFSDKQFGGEQEALEAALTVRNLVLEKLRLYPNDPARAFDECRDNQPVGLYPKGLRPRKGSAA